jgi:hypothetical protein
MKFLLNFRQVRNLVTELLLNGLSHAGTIQPTKIEYSNANPLHLNKIRIFVNFGADSDDFHM